jgi:hypothetical protein
VFAGLHQHTAPCKPASGYAGLVRLAWRAHLREAALAVGAGYGRVDERDLAYTDRASLGSEAPRRIASIPVTYPRARPWRSLPSERGPAADQSNRPSA